MILFSSPAARRPPPAAGLPCRPRCAEHLDATSSPCRPCLRRSRAHPRHGAWTPTSALAAAPRPRPPIPLPRNRGRPVRCARLDGPGRAGRPQLTYALLRGAGGGRSVAMRAVWGPRGRRGAARAARATQNAGADACRPVPAHHRSVPGPGGVWVGRFQRCCRHAAGARPAGRRRLAGACAPVTQVGCLRPRAAGPPPCAPGGGRAAARNVPCHPPLLPKPYP